MVGLCVDGHIWQKLVVQLQHLQHKILVLGLTVGELEQTDGTETFPKEWFHFDCGGLTQKPSGKWFCSGHVSLSQAIISPSSAPAHQQ